MAKETKEKTQIGWGSLDNYSRLYADVPGSSDRVWFEMKELHETWKDFILAYGVKQYVSSALAKVSFSVDSQLKMDIIDAQLRASEGDLEAGKELTELREKARTAKTDWLKKNTATIRTALFNELKALKVEKAKKESAGRATKAEIESAAIKAENDRLVAQAVENAAKMGIPVEIAMQLMGVKPIEAAVEAEAEEVETEVPDVLNDEELAGSE